MTPLHNRLPPVSVVMPAYNLADRIDRSLRALTGHDYAVLEIIVVDDGSNDGTAEVVRRHPGVRLIRHSRNQGVAAARNAGVRAASHELICLLDADCVVQPGTIERLVRRLLSDLRYGVVSGSYLSAASKSNLANRVYDVAERYRDFALGPRKYPYTTVSNAIMRKSLFERVGGFSVRWRRIQDYEFTYRVHRAGYINLHDPSIHVEHNNHRETLGSYYSHIYQVARFGTVLRLQHRPSLPYSKYLAPSLPLFVLLTPAYFMMHVAKVCLENWRVRRVRQLLAVFPFVLWSRAVYTAGSVAGCAAYNNWKSSGFDPDPAAALAPARPGNSRAS